MSVLRAILAIALFALSALYAYFAVEHPKPSGYVAFAVLSFGFAVFVVLSSLIATRTERNRLLAEQNALLRRSVKLQEAQLRLQMLERAEQAPSQPPAQPEGTSSEGEVSDAAMPDVSKVTIRRGEMHVYVKPVRPKPESPEGAAHRERYERLIERLRRQRRD